MDRSDVQRWVEAYRVAWESNDPDDIAGLFTDDARYYTAPFREPWDGVDAIVDGWIDRKDEPGDATFTYEVIGVDRDLGVVRGQTHYPKDDPPRYSNLWLIRLAPDGRATEFIEYWMGYGVTQLLVATAGGLYVLEEGGEDLEEPWGGPPDVRSLSVGVDHVIYANVHVGGILRSRDGGQAWEPTIDVDDGRPPRVVRGRWR